MKTGVLLINLGTPDSPERGDVARYLRQFLLDPRVLDIPWIKRQFVVRCIIAPFRAVSSGKTYKEIWRAEGSPLLLYTKEMTDLLQASLGEDYIVSFGMRYQNPSIEKALETLQRAQVDRIVLLPLFPQYASASTGSAMQEALRVISQWEVIPELHTIDHYPTHPQLIEAFAARGEQYDIQDYDHVLFSFHGLPERQIRKADPTGKCLTPGCCDQWTQRGCYKGQSYATAREIAKRLGLSESRWSVSFQSRLGKDPWIQPYTPAALEELAKKGAKRLLVFSPAFVCDCLETTYEIGVEYQELFESFGGEKVQLVEGLNTHPMWIETMRQLVEEKTLVPVC